MESVVDQRNKTRTALASARFVLSMALLGIALVLILGTPSPASSAISSTIVGVVLGYWFGHAERTVVP